jgi:hypothetical protein
MEQGLGIEFADATAGADGKGEQERVPIAVGVGGLVERGIGVEGTPVAAVVDGDVGAVGSYSNPGFGGSVVSDGGAVAVGHGVGGCPAFRAVGRDGGCANRIIGLVVGATGRNDDGRQCADFWRNRSHAEGEDA